MSDTTAGPQPWKLVNMKVPLDALKRIDKQAHKLGLTRTSYMIGQSDPKIIKARAAERERELA